MFQGFAVDSSKSSPEIISLHGLWTFQSNIYKEQISSLSILFFFVGGTGI
jgi:hypothetical protein